MARYTDAVIVMNQADEDACKRYRLTRPGGQSFRLTGEGVVIEDWIDPPSPAELEELEERLGLRPDKPLVLFLGRFIGTKRPGDVLEAARRIGDAADFVMAGEGPLWKKIHRQSLDIGSHVHVIEFTHQTRALMHRCAVLVMPSVFREGMPRVLLEAQLVGKPPIAYDVRGSSDAIVHERTGLLVPPRDVDGFCEALAQLLADPERRERMGQAGAERVRTHFSFAAIAAEHVKFIHQVLEQ